MDETKKSRNRRLRDDSAVYSHNAWDDVEWDQEALEAAKKKIVENSAALVPEEERERYEEKAKDYWDHFYSTHQNKFFKDRHWLFVEFPELLNYVSPESVDEYCILELGCGVGNTVFPILEMNRNPNLKVYCCDFSSKAISILQENSLFVPNICHPFVQDISREWTVPFQNASLDAVMMIFTLSAVDPSRMSFVLEQTMKYLKPGGLLLFRDYGRNDMAQLRFKKGRCLSENFYVRGDGTRAYFFTEEELDHLFRKVGFEKKELIVDKRLQVNRGKQQKMYRVWIQAKYTKVLE